MALVLCAGTNATLVETRRRILQRGRHQVLSAICEAQVEQLCAGHAFQVAVIGQEASPAVKKCMLARVRSHCPNAKVLELLPAHASRILDDADEWLEVPAPGELLARVNHLPATTEVMQLAAARKDAETLILNGWKEIARHVGRGVRTVQRWEQHGLPVRRPAGRNRSAVFALSDEIEAWARQCSTRSELDGQTRDQAGAA